MMCLPFLFCMSASHAATSVVQDDIAACMKRKSMALASCKSGCGLIAKSCYDEVEDGYVSTIHDTIAATSAIACPVDLRAVSEKYDALRGDIEGALEPGSWQQLDMRLILLGSQLELLRAVQRRCAHR
ncbi:hypothetical protein B551_0221880 [Cupriavidus sp. HPC(L)]|nr:hypothetical protein B551_0221880 [Cupriavidus sp. HPC(L)]